ncbi:MAG: sulfurtransferase [Propionibacteriaceae bacterium]|nr:sulfurtransferase [Propionibacteriaceae bacterium]
MTTLITADELRHALAGDEPPVILDARYPGPAATGNGLPAFREGHIPGSAWIDVDTELAGPAVGPGGRHPLPEPSVFEAALRRAGVGCDGLVVVLDADNSLAAGRLWWLLRDAGHDRVRVLDGGFAAWQRAGGATETGDPAPRPEGDFTARPGQLPVADAEHLTALLDARSAGSALERPALWDVRAPERFRGETEPIDPVAGHIPGARNLPAAALQHPDGTFLPADELRGLLEGVRPGDVVYCGSGITAAQALVAMAHAGTDAGVRLYPGSWSDWISTGDRPIERG